LFPIYQKKHNYSERSFDVLIVRELTRLSNFLRRKDKGHQRVYYSLNKRGFQEVGRVKLKNQFNNWIDEMNLKEIRAWLRRLKERGMRLEFTDNAIVRDEDGRIKGKGIGFQSLEYGTSFLTIVKDKEGKVLQEIEIDKNGKMHRLSSSKKEKMK
jgi:ribosomal protein L15